MVNKDTSCGFFFFQDPMGALLLNDPSSSSAATTTTTTARPAEIKAAIEELSSPTNQHKTNLEVIVEEENRDEAAAAEAEDGMASATATQATGNTTATGGVYTQATQDSSLCMSPKDSDLEDTTATNKTNDFDRMKNKLLLVNTASAASAATVESIRTPGVSPTAGGANNTAATPMATNRHHLPPKAPPAATKTTPTSGGPPCGEVVFEKELHKELDFDVNPSELYLLLQRRDWAGATNRLKTHPEEATYWISRKELDGKLRWRLLPVHGAIIFSAPYTMIQSLVDAYPASASSKDDQGMLPLHLSYRMGSPSQVVEVLLNAFPESVDIKDRKGRTPIIMAQTSKGPNRNEFLKAIEKTTTPKQGGGGVGGGGAGGLTPRSTLSATSARSLPPPSPASASAQQQAAAQLKEMELSYKSEIDASEKNASDLEKQLTKLKAELKLSEETSTVLLGHVASLEKAKTQSEETETALATRIATLDNSYKATLREKQALEQVLTNERDKLVQKNEELEKLLIGSHEDYKRLKERINLTRSVADKDKQEMDEKYKGRTEEYNALQKDYQGVCNNVQILEAQLRAKIIHEQKLVKQVSSLARQLSATTEDNDKATRAFSERLHTLTTERDDLRNTIKMLCKKLFAVALFLGDMETEQEEIFDKAVTRGKEMDDAVAKHRVLVEDVRAQSAFFDEAKDQRSLLMELMRQQEIALQRANIDRERIVTAIEDHAKHVESNVQIRQELVEDAGNLKHQISDILGSVKLFIPKQSSNDDEMVDEVIRTVLSKHDTESDSAQSDSEHQDADHPIPGGDNILEQIMKKHAARKQQEEKEDVQHLMKKLAAVKDQEESGSEDEAAIEEKEETAEGPEAEATAEEADVKHKEDDAVPVVEETPEPKDEEKSEAVVLEGEEHNIEKTVSVIDVNQYLSDPPSSYNYDAAAAERSSIIEQIMAEREAEHRALEEEKEKVRQEEEQRQKQEEEMKEEEEKEEEQVEDAEPAVPVGTAQMVEIHIDIESELNETIETPFVLDAVDEVRDEVEPTTPAEQEEGEAAITPAPVEEISAEVNVVEPWKDMESPCEKELGKWKHLLEGGE